MSDNQARLSAVLPPHSNTQLRFGSFTDDLPLYTYTNLAVLLPSQLTLVKARVCQRLPVLSR